MALCLDDFIATTLTGIIKGIDKAKDGLKDRGRSDWVSPPIDSVGKGGAIHDTDVSVLREGG